MSADDTTHVPPVLFDTDLVVEPDDDGWPDQMRQHWFGEPWPSPARRALICADDAFRVPTPVGQACLWCTEPIAPDDQGVTVATFRSAHGGAFSMEAVHIECQFRQVFGGPAHADGTCTCASGQQHDPDAGMSARDAARYVWQHYGAGQP